MTCIPRHDTRRQLYNLACYMRGNSKLYNLACYIRGNSKLYNLAYYIRGNSKLYNLAYYIRGSSELTAQHSASVTYVSSISSVQVVVVSSITISMSTQPCLSHI